MILPSILESVVNAFQESNTEKVLYLSLDKQLISAYRTFVPGNYVVYDMDDPKVFYTPLSPFFLYLKDRNLAEEEIESRCFAPQKEAFVNYLTGKEPPERRDLPFWTDIFYEKRRNNQTVVELFKCLDSPRLVILNAQNMQKGCTDLLETIAQNKSVDLKVILCFDSYKLRKPLRENAFYSNMITENSFYEFTLSTYPETNPSIPFPTHVNNFKDCLINIRYLRMFLSNDIGCIFGKNIQNGIPAIVFSDEEECLILLEYGVINFFNTNFDYAISIFSQVISIGHPAYLPIAQYFMAVIYYYRTDYEKAISFANMALSTAPENSITYAKTFALTYFIRERSDRTDSVEKYQTARRLLKEAGLLITYINLSMQIPQRMQVDPAYDSEVQEILEDCLQKAQKMGHEQLVSKVYHWQGIIYTKKEKLLKAIEVFEKADAIKRVIANVSDAITLRSGFSYALMLIAEYERAYNLLNTEAGSACEIKEYQQIILLLFNMSMILFFGRNFNLAEAVLKDTLKLKSLYNLSDSVYCGNKDLDLLLAFISFTKGNVSKAKLTIQRNAMVDTVQCSATYPLADFLMALIALKEGKPIQSQKHFSNCIKNHEKKCPELKHELAFLYYEYASYLDLYNQVELADSYHKEGRKVAQEANLFYYARIIDSLTYEEYRESHFPFERPSYNIKDLENLAIQKNINSKLQNKIEGITFLKQISEAGKKEISISKYLSTVAKAVSDYSLCESVYIATKVSGKWEIKGQSGYNQRYVPTQKQWNSCLEDVPGKIVFQDDGDEFRIQWNISVPDLKAAIILYPTQKAKIRDPEVEIITIATSEIFGKLKFFAQEVFLEKNTSRDALTTLGNNQALEYAIEITSQLFKRYKDIKNVKKTVLSISIIELDNYDEIGPSNELVRENYIHYFALVTRSQFRKTDFIYRFNEKTFVIIHPATPSKNVVIAMNRLRKTLSVPINQEINYPGSVDFIPEFTCGIASNADTEDPSDIGGVLELSLQALSRAKLKGANSTFVWK